MQNSENNIYESSIKDLWNIACRRKVILAACIILCIAAGFIVTKITPCTYSAKSQLIFYRSAYAVLMNNSNYVPQVEDKLTQVYLIKGDTVAEQASNILRSQGFSISPGEIKSSISVRDVENTGLIEISAESTDPKKAMWIANSVMEAFLYHKRQVGKNNDEKNCIDLARQLKASRAELAKCEDALAKYMAKHGIVDAENITNAEQSSLMQLQIELEQARLEQSSARAKVRALSSQLSRHNNSITSSGAIRDNALVKSLRQRLVDLEMRLASERLEYTDEYPGKLENIKEEINDIRRRLSNEVSSIVSGGSTSLESQEQTISELAAQQTEYVAASSRYSALRSAISRHEASLKSLPNKLLNYNRLVRESKAAEQVYTSLLNSYQAAKTDKVRQKEPVQVAEVARLPMRPIRPDMVQNMFVAMLIGIIIGILGVIVLEWTDDGLRGAEQLRQCLQLPVLGQIPIMSGKSRILTQLGLNSPIGESYRYLRTNITFASREEPIKSILVTSPSVSEGKSVTATNLAVSLAQEGKNVILVDCDLRHPTISKMLNIETIPGVTDVLAGNVELAYAVKDVPGISFLGVLPAGMPTPTPAELSGSRRMAALISELERIADIVVIDASPCNVVADSLLISAFVDAVIEVVAVGETSMKSALAARESLESAGARVIGAVINKAGKVPRRYYDKKYYGYYVPKDRYVYRKAA